MIFVWIFLCQWSKKTRMATLHSSWRTETLLVPVTSCDKSWWLAVQPGQRRSEEIAFLFANKSFLPNLALKIPGMVTLKENSKFAHLLNLKPNQTKPLLKQTPSRSKLLDAPHPQIIWVFSQLFINSLHVSIPIVKQSRALWKAHAKCTFILHSHFSHFFYQSKSKLGSDLTLGSTSVKQNKYET